MRTLPAFRPLVASVLSVATLAAAGCATAPRSTQHTGSDLIEASDTFRDALARSDWLRARTPDQPRARLGLGDTVNRSADRLSQGARRLVIARALLGEGMLELFDARGVDVVLPPLEAAELERLGVTPTAHLAEYDTPTHLAEAEFSSLTRLASLTGDVADARRDTFIVRLTIIEADTRRAVFTHSFEYARIADGALFD